MFFCRWRTKKSKKCAVCLKRIKKPKRVVLRCGHVYHRRCLLGLSHCVSPGCPGILNSCLNLGSNSPIVL